jgi:hypothetical protein
VAALSSRTVALPSGASPLVYARVVITFIGPPGDGGDDGLPFHPTRMRSSAAAMLTAGVSARSPPPAAIGAWRRLPARSTVANITWLSYQTIANPSLIGTMRGPYVTSRSIGMPGAAPRVTGSISGRPNRSKVWNIRKLGSITPNRIQTAAKRPPPQARSNALS